MEDSVQQCIILPNKRKIYKCKTCGQYTKTKIPIDYDSQDDLISVSSMSSGAYEEEEQMLIENGYYDTINNNPS